MNTSIIFAALVAWLLCGVLELWLDTRWHRRAFPMVAWTMDWARWHTWPVYIFGPIGLLFGTYWRTQNWR